MNKIVFLFVFFILGCGNEPKKYLHKDIYEYMMREAPEKYFDQSIMADVNYFLNECEKKQCGYPKKNILRHVSFFSDNTEIDDGVIVGQCFTGDVRMPFGKQDIRVIKISKILKDLGPFSLKSTIYHETVHCLFDYLEHSPDENHIMNAYLQPEWYLKDNLNYMVDQIIEELKDRSKYERIVNQNGNF